MEAPPLPASEADLADWSVYADYLLAQGDPRGELIATDLALPAAPAPEQIATFRALAKGLLPAREKTPVAWTLGHARTIDISAQSFKLGKMGIGPAASACDFLATPPAQRIEEVSTNVVVWNNADEWARIAAALPASCRHIVVRGRREAIPSWLVASLPPTVRELSGIHVGGDAVSDRFDVVTLHRAFDRNARDSIVPALLRTRSVKLRVGDAHAMIGVPWERVVFTATPGDAALVRRGRAITLSARTLLQRQRWFGPINVRAQLARTVPEKMEQHLDLVRHADRWTVRGHVDIRASLNGVPLPHDQVITVAHGDRIGIDDDDYELVTPEHADVDAACRRAVEL